MLFPGHKNSAVLSTLKVQVLRVVFLQQMLGIVSADGMIDQTGSSPANATIQMELFFPPFSSCSTMVGWIS